MAIDPMAIAGRKTTVPARRIAGPTVIVQTVRPPSRRPARPATRTTR
jgi:hypothetical protein